MEDFQKNILKVRIFSNTVIFQVIVKIFFKVIYVKRIIIPVNRAVGSFYMVGGLSKNVGHHGQRQKIEKKKHWLKHSKAVPKKEIWTKIQMIQNVTFGIIF